MLLKRCSVRHALGGAKRGAGPVLAGVVLLGAALAGEVAADEAQSPPVTSDGEPLFARVGDDEITRDTLEAAIARAMRKKYYHFQPPEKEREAFRREVAHDAVTRALLLQEATRRGLNPDADRIRQQLDDYGRRYAQSERWQSEGPQMLEALETYLGQEDRLRQLEQQVRMVEPPTERQVRQYYVEHPEKFTEPVRSRVSLILLRVDPSSSGDVWQAALNEGEKLVTRLRDGADFAELAQMFSDDPVSAGKGGDMGYLHRGMLGPQAEEALEALALGDVSEPMRLLEGVAILRLDDRKEPRLLPWDQVRERAEELWSQDRANAAWAALKRQLWHSTPITIYDPALAPEPDAQTNLRGYSLPGLAIDFERA